MNIYTIYRITNLTNNKPYIGWTSREPHKRFTEHKSAKTDMVIHHAIRKYGPDSFTFEIIYQSSNEIHSKEMESYFIVENNSINYGYNVEAGGLGHTRTEESIDKHRQKILGTKQSQEWIDKRKQFGSNNGMSKLCGELHPSFGKKRSEESKQKMRDAKAKSKLQKQQRETEVSLCHI